MERSVPLLLALAVASIAALVSGGAFLEAPIPGGLPVGNLLAATSLAFLAAAAIGIGRPGSMSRRFSAVALVAALAWLPVSIGLAGNLALNFSGARGQAWLWLSAATAVMIVVALAWATAGRLLRRRAHHGPGTTS